MASSNGDSHKYITQPWLRQIYSGFKVVVKTMIPIYLSTPLVFRFCPFVQRQIVFLRFKRLWPAGVNFSDPASQGLVGGRNIYLDIEPDQKIGVWHLLPSSEVEKSKGKPKPHYWDESLRNSGKNVIMYLHGNTGSRGGDRKKELYTLLQNEGFHVVAFDYRDYADSTMIPASETTTVADAIRVYRWIKSELGSGSRIFVWGHSLGSAVSSHFVSKLCEEGNPPANLILESPFTSMGEVVKHHWCAAPWRYMPFFDWFFVAPLKKNDFGFESDRHIANIHIPILILHAIDDPFVPMFLGRKLYKIGLTTRNHTAKPIYFRRFGEGYGHRYICRAPDLPALIREFYRCTVQNDWRSQMLEELARTEAAQD